MLLFYSESFGQGRLCLSGLYISLAERRCRFIRISLYQLNMNIVSAARLRLLHETKTVVWHASKGYSFGLI